MKTLCLIVMLLIPSLCQAWYGFAVLARNDIQGWVWYDYQVGVEPNDPAWQTLKAEHLGRRDGSIQHAAHTSYITVLVLPFVMTHPTPKAQYSMRHGTHQYCAVLTPFSELLNSPIQGEQDQIIAAPAACHTICWDLCQTC